MANLLLWVAVGVAVALIGFWLFTRRTNRGPSEVMERLAGSSERPPAFGRPSASVWDQESKSGEVAPPPDDPGGHRPKGKKPSP